MTGFRRRFLYIVAYMVLLLLVGTVGFAMLPGWTIGDAAYMTIITVSAVGYEEVQDLQGAGRILASLLIIGGITALGLWFAIITTAILEMDLAHTFRTRRTMKNIEKVSDHVVVCGAGRTGRQVIKELSHANVPYVVIERSAGRADVVRDMEPDALILERDATEDESLVGARLGHARGLVSALSADTDNLFVCLSARDLQPGLTIVTRAYEEQAVEKMQRAGADHVISPKVTGGIRMASMLLRPQVMTFLDVVTRAEGDPLLLEQVTVPEGSRLLGHTLVDARIPQKTGLIVIAIKHGDEARGQFRYNPGPSEQVRADDTLIVLGRQDQIDLLRVELRS